MDLLPRIKSQCPGKEVLGKTNNSPASVPKRKMANGDGRRAGFCSEVARLHCRERQLVRPRVAPAGWGGVNLNAGGRSLRQ